MNYAVLEGSEIWRIFATKKLAELFREYQEPEYSEDYRIVETTEPLTIFPVGDYYEDWNK